MAQVINGQIKGRFCKVGDKYLSVSLSEPDLNFYHCPVCKCLTQQQWVEDEDINLLGYACMVCDELCDDQYDPTPMEQWEVTEGTSERERHEVMIKNLEGTR